VAAIAPTYDLAAPGAVTSGLDEFNEHVLAAVSKITA
jgi:hypothetical protein